MDRMNRWRQKLDANLPGELRRIAEWIARAERTLAEEIHFDPSKSTPGDNLQRSRRLLDEHAVRTDCERRGITRLVSFIGGV